MHYKFSFNLGDCGTGTENMKGGGSGRARGAGGRRWRGRRLWKGGGRTSLDVSIALNVAGIRRFN